MAFSFSNTDRGLLYEERGHLVAARTAFTAVGLIAILSSYFFVDLILGMGKLGSPAKVGGLIAAVLGLICFCLFGGYCLKLAFFTPMQRVFFDAARKQVVCAVRSPAAGLREVAYPFSAVASVEVVRHLAEDGEITFSLALDVAAADKFELGVFSDQQQAISCAQQVRQVIGHVP
jgi:hypothetical protein